MAKDKKKKRFRWLRTAIGTWLGYKSITYVINHPHLVRDLKQSITDYINAIQSFAASVSSLKSNTANLRNQLDKTQKTMEEINTSVEHFQYKLEPRLARINELEEHIQKELDSIGSPTNVKK